MLDILDILENTHHHSSRSRRNSQESQEARQLQKCQRTFFLRKILLSPSEVIVRGNLNQKFHNNPALYSTIDDIISKPVHNSFDKLLNSEKQLLVS